MHIRYPYTCKNPYKKSILSNKESKMAFLGGLRNLWSRKNPKNIMVEQNVKKQKQSECQPLISILFFHLYRYQLLC